MYCDPLAGEGLFPIDEPGKTERDLPFEFDRGVDYFAVFDAMLPPWQVFPYAVEKGSKAAFSDASGAAEVRMGSRTTSVVSYRRYVRAIDPGGNLCQLIVSTCRPGPHYKDGFDTCGTYSRVISTKNARGWLIVERDPLTWSLYSGRRDQEYAAWALAVMQYRKLRHSAAQAAEAETSREKTAEKRRNADMEAQRQMNRDMVVDVAKAVVEATASNRGQPRRDRSPE